MTGTPHSAKAACNSLPSPALNLKEKARMMSTSGLPLLDNILRIGTSLPKTTMKFRPCSSMEREISFNSFCSWRVKFGEWNVQATMPPSFHRPFSCDHLRNSSMFLNHSLRSGWSSPVSGSSSGGGIWTFAWNSSFMSHNAMARQLFGVRKTAMRQGVHAFSRGGEFLRQFSQFHDMSIDRHDIGGFGGGKSFFVVAAEAERLEGDCVWGLEAVERALIGFHVRRSAEHDKRGGHGGQA